MPRKFGFCDKIPLIKSREFRVRQPLLVLILLWLTASDCFASLTVFLTDGSSMEATKIEFHGDKVRVFLKTGKTEIIPLDKMDFDATAIDRPESGTFGLTVYSTNRLQNEKNAGPSQEELRQQWESATESATAVKNVGSLKKGDAVRIISSGWRYIVVVKDSEGNYRRQSFDAGTFQEVFSTESDAQPRTPPTPPRSQSEQRVPEPEAAPSAVLPEQKAVDPEVEPEPVEAKPAEKNPSSRDKAIGLLAICGIIVLLGFYTHWRNRKAPAKVGPAKDGEFNLFDYPVVKIVGGVLILWLAYYFNGELLELESGTREKVRTLSYLVIVYSLFGRVAAVDLHALLGSVILVWGLIQLARKRS